MHFEYRLKKVIKKLDWYGKFTYSNANKNFKIVSLMKYFYALLTMIMSYIFCMK